MDATASVQDQELGLMNGRGYPMDEPNDSLNCAKQSNEPDQAAPEAASSEKEAAEPVEPQPELLQAECAATGERKASVEGPVNPLIEPPSPGPDNSDTEEKPKMTAVSRLIAKLGGKRRAAIMVCVAAAVILFLPSIVPQLFCNHDSWKDATCTEPRTCESCGKTDGQPLGHDWTDATCTEPKTCARCKTTEGQPLGHEPAEWTKETDYVNATSREVQKCDWCGEVVNTRSETKMTTFVGDGAFTISPKDFIERLNEEFSSLPGYSTMSADYELGSGGIALDLRIKKGSKSVGVGGFYADSSTQLLFSYFDAENSFKNIVMYFGDSSEYTAATAVATIQAIDPSLSFSDAKEVASDCAGKVIVNNGVTYAVLNSGDGYWLSARID